MPAAASDTDTRRWGEGVAHYTASSLGFIFIAGFHHWASSPSLGFIIHLHYWASLSSLGFTFITGLHHWALSSPPRFICIAELHHYLHHWASSSFTGFRLHHWASYSSLGFISVYLSSIFNTGLHHSSSSLGFTFITRFHNWVSSSSLGFTFITRFHNWVSSSSPSVCRIPWSRHPRVFCTLRADCRYHTYSAHT